VDTQIGEDLALDATTAAARLITAVTAVSKPLLARFRYLADALIQPIPDEGAPQARVSPDDIPIFLQISWTVTHDARVLRQDKGHGFTWCLGNGDQSVQGRELDAEDIQVRSFRAVSW